MDNWMDGRMTESMVDEGTYRDWELRFLLQMDFSLQFLVIRGR